MERFIRGEIVVISFPFSDFSGSKKRPALVIADLRGDDVLLCQITSKQSNDTLALALHTADFIFGSLPTDSFIRPLRIFNADKNIILRRAGKISPALVNNVIDVIVFTLRQ